MSFITKKLEEFENFIETHPLKQCDWCDGFGGNIDNGTTAPSFIPCKKCHNIHPQETNIKEYLDYFTTALNEMIKEVEKILPERIDDNSEHYNDCLEEIRQSLKSLREGNK